MRLFVLVDGIVRLSHFSVRHGVCRGVVRRFWGNVRLFHSLPSEAHCHDAPPAGKIWQAGAPIAFHVFSAGPWSRRAAKIDRMASLTHGIWFLTHEVDTKSSSRPHSPRIGAKDEEEDTNS